MRTNQLRERVYIALQAALLEVDVDEIMLPESSDEVLTYKVRENDVRHIIGSAIYVNDHCHRVFSRTTSSHLLWHNESWTESTILYLKK